jgi:hypothetical protein
MKRAQSKSEYSAKTLYVEHTQNGHMRLDLNLPVSLLPDNMTVSGLVGQEHPLEVWVAYLESLRAKRAGVAHSGTLSPWEEIEIPTFKGFMKASASFKTPKKLKLGKVLSPCYEPNTWSHSLSHGRL